MNFQSFNFVFENKFSPLYLINIARLASFYRFVFYYSIDARIRRISANTFIREVVLLDRDTIAADIEIVIELKLCTDWNAIAFQ